MGIPGGPVGRRVPRTTMAAVLVLLAMACGTRVPHEQIVAVGQVEAESPGGVQGTAPGPATPGDSDVGEAGDRGEAPGGGDSSGATALASEAAGDVTVEEPVGEAASTEPGRRATSVPTPDREPVVIGNIGTYSGVLSPISVPGRRMVQVWARWVNENGGLDGHPVELITVDDRGDPSRAQALARELVEERGAVAFLNNFTPLTWRGYVDYVEAQGVPVVGGELTDDRFFFDSPMVFPQGSTLAAGVLAAGAAAVDAGRANVGVVYCAELEQCAGVRDTYVRDGDRVGANVVYEQEVSLAQPNFTRECLDARNSNVETLHFSLTTDAIKRVLRDCEAQGFSPLGLGGQIAVDHTLADEPTADGMVLSGQVFPFPLTDTGATREYGEAIERFAPDLQLGGSAAHAWVAGKLLEAAAEGMGGNGGLTSRNLLDGLWSLPDGVTLDGLTVPLTFTEGQPAEAADCGFELQIADGAFTAPQGLETQCL